MTSEFEQISLDELVRILGITIKRDETNKLVTFLSLLTAYTEDSQINISFNAPSSTGKSFIPTEVASLFPSEDVMELGYTSPTAFFHSVGKFDKEKDGYIVDLSRKIMIFLDQPHDLLLQHLRPFLSHDKKEICLKITDKTQKFGLRAKNVFLIGFPVVVFCTAGLNFDEQEATRFLLLSPEIDKEKIKEAIWSKIRKESNGKEYFDELLTDPSRKRLIERIVAIKAAEIRQINIPEPEKIQEQFMGMVSVLKPRNQRDIGRVMSLIKALALLNLWSRVQEGGVLHANEEDIKEGFKLWKIIYESQDLNLPPYVFNLYKDVILAGFEEKNRELHGGIKAGLSRQDIAKKHHDIYGRFLPDWQLRQQIIPPLETAGLITQEPDLVDKRRMLIYPTASLTNSSDSNNSESEGGVDDDSRLEKDVKEVFSS